MSTFINPFTDFGFKYIFGREESKPFLIDFLNSLLKDEPDFDTIVSLNYLDKEMSKSRKDERGVIYDIHCTTSNGRQFIVEMQKKSQEFFIERAIYYLSKAVVDQGVTGGDWDFEYMPVYFISFMDFVLSRFDNRFRMDCSLCDLQTKKPISDKMRFIFIQMPLFDKKTPEECSDNIDKWFYILNNMFNMETMPFTPQEILFNRLSQVASYASLSPEEKRIYDADLKRYRDITNQIAFGFKEGKAEGRAEGITEGKIQIVRRMRRKGLDNKTIAFLTGEDPDWVNSVED